MKICGLNKTTLLDYPGKVATTIFLGGCNLRCPYCQNGGLVLHPEQEPEITQEKIFAFLKKRKGILDGVCVTGGEPTLSPELPMFIKRIKEEGYLVKLDTNGTRPKVIRALLENHLLDYIAMDIKSDPKHYAKVTGIPTLDLDEIRESVELIKNSHIEYEFRTTVVRQLHEGRDFVEIGKWLFGVSHYYLQSYRDSESVMVSGFSSYSREELEEYQGILRNTIPSTEIRGVD